MYSKTSELSSWRVGQDRRRTSSFFRVAKKLSATALMLLICARLGCQRVRCGGAWAWWVVWVRCARTPSLIWRFVRVGGEVRAGDRGDRPPPGRFVLVGPGAELRKLFGGRLIGGNGVAEPRAARQATGCVVASAGGKATVAGGSRRLTRASAPLAIGQRRQGRPAGDCTGTPRSSDSPPSRAKTRIITALRGTRGACRAPGSDRAGRWAGWSWRGPAL
jgi:hypothetical protein